MTGKLKFFGTDGIRGKFGGKVINEKLAQALGLAFARFLEENNPDITKPILLARDTRSSGEKLLASCMEGLKKRNFRVINLGILPTPTLAFSIVNQNALGGIMVTASHNPHYDNGLKILTKDGGKLTIEQELSIESYISTNDYDSNITDYTSEDSNYREAYLENLTKWFDFGFLKGIKIVIDLANGATKEISPVALRKFGADVICLNQGEGLINDEVGSEFTQGLSQRVHKEKADIGIAHDGDGDRVIFVDEKGKKIDGDQILGILALHNPFKDSHISKGFVATVHSNSGLEYTLKNKGISFYRADVGDRNVFSLMKEKGIKWGGESSGHIIYSNYLNTGDGLFSALSVLKIMKQNHVKISELANQISLWPSISLALEVDTKKPISQFENLQKYLRKVKSAYSEQARVLIRYSGTEPKIRILVEAIEEELKNDIFSNVQRLVSEHI